MDRCNEDEMKIKNLEIYLHAYWCDPDWWTVHKVFNFSVICNMSKRELIKIMSRHTENKTKRNEL